MIQRLEAHGLLVREAYAGATLTEEGRETASEPAESHATLARFFRDVLGPEEHHEEALAVAGRVSPQVTDRLAATLLEEGGAEGRAEVDLEDAPFTPV